MILAGTGLSYIGRGLLDNNTVIIAGSNGDLSDLHCTSSSTIPNIGSWISPNGVNVTRDTSDPFDVLVGGSNDPASLIITQRSGHLITRSFQGVYTCAINDAIQQLKYLQVGIYPSGFNSK